LTGSDFSIFLTSTNDQVGLNGGDKPARVGAARGLVGESFPQWGSSVKRLGDVSHMREGILKLSQLRVEPALTAAVAG